MAEVDAVVGRVVGGRVVAGRVVAPVVAGRVDVGVVGAGDVDVWVLDVWVVDGPVVEGVVDGLVVACADASRTGPVKRRAPRRAVAPCTGECVLSAASMFIPNASQAEP